MSAHTRPPRVATRAPVSGAGVLGRSVAAEWTRLWTVRSTWWFLLTATVMIVGLGALLGLESAADPVEIQGEPAWTTARFIALPAQFAFLGLAVVGVTSDYVTGGIVPTLQWTSRRLVVLVARSVVVVATTSGIGLLLTTSAALAAYATADGALTLEGGAGVDMLRTVAFVLLAGTSLAAGLGLLLRTSPGALVSVLLLMLVLPLTLPLFGVWMQTVAGYLPGSGAIYLLTAQGRDLTTASSVAVMLTWAIAALVLGGLRLVRDDASR